MDVKLKLTTEEHKDLVAYCNLNDLLMSSVVKNSFTTGFNIEKYGLLNAGPKTTEKIVEKEVIKYIEVPKIEEKEIVKIEYVEIEKPVEIIKEVPVEKVIEKIVEVIKEVPLEKIVTQEIVREVPIDKIVYVTDQKEINEKILQKEMDFEEERKNFSTKLESMEKNFQEEKNELTKKISELENTPPTIIEKVVEVVKELPVIQEVIIEKEVNGDNDKIDALQKTIFKLRQENVDKEKVIMQLSKTIDEIQKSQEERRAIFLRGSNLEDKL